MGKIKKTLWKKGRKNCKMDLTSKEIREKKSKRKREKFQIRSMFKIRR
jgi:hypothetical protein